MYQTEKDDIAQEVLELFAEYDNGLFISMSNAVINDYFDDVVFFEGTEAHQLLSMPEILCAWYADESQGDIGAEDFLKKNQIDKFMSSKDFSDVINNKALLPFSFMPLLQKKLPFSISVRRLEALNRLQYVKARKARSLKMNSELIFSELKKIRTAQKEKIEERKRRYYQAHKEEYKLRCQKWRKEHPEELKECLRLYRQNRKENIAEIKKRYYENHKEVLLKKAQEWRQENKDKVKENSHENYMKNREKRLSQNKEWVKNNPEARRAQKARYYAAHAKEIAEKEARRRNEKRFKTKTGSKILTLLQGIIASRS